MILSVWGIHVASLLKLTDLLGLGDFRGFCGEAPRWRAVGGGRSHKMNRNFTLDARDNDKNDIDLPIKKIHLCLFEERKKEKEDEEGERRREGKRRW